ncbi:hypothetical protein [Bacillus sp. NTK034]|nr:hypothetical protein [Bacillus sp. NTK034]MBN8200986.1 hypothetical protein [Bacillus sp. NTK034]
MNFTFAAGAVIWRIRIQMKITMPNALAAVWILSRQRNMTYRRVEK